MICCLHVFSLGQIKISGDEYLQEYIEALAKSRATPRRHRETTTWYKLGKVVELWNAILETDENGNSRFRHETKRGAKATSFETIAVDGVVYCRKNREGWIITDECGSGANKSPVSGTTTEKFSTQALVLAGQKAKLLRAYTITEELDAKDKITGKLWFTENKVWISEDKLILKREYVTGLLPRKINYTVVENYDYNAKVPRIVAPSIDVLSEI